MVAFVYLSKFQEMVDKHLQIDRWPDWNSQFQIIDDGDSIHFYNRTLEEPLEENGFILIDDDVWDEDIIYEYYQDCWGLNQQTVDAMLWHPENGLWIDTSNDFIQDFEDIPDFLRSCGYNKKDLFIVYPHEAIYLNGYKHGSGSEKHFDVNYDTYHFSNNLYHHSGVRRWQIDLWRVKYDYRNCNTEAHGCSTAIYTNIIDGCSWYLAPVGATKNTVLNIGEPIDSYYIRTNRFCYYFDNWEVGFTDAEVPGINNPDAGSDDPLSNGYVNYSEWNYSLYRIKNNQMDEFTYVRHANGFGGHKSIFYFAAYDMNIARKLGAQYKPTFPPHHGLSRLTHGIGMLTTPGEKNLQDLDANGSWKSYYETYKAHHKRISNREVENWNKYYAIWIYFDTNPIACHFEGNEDGNSSYRHHYRGAWANKIGQLIRISI